jgi:hypothetical protein
MARLLGICVAFIFALSIALTGSAGAKVGASCGGFIGPWCADNEFCQKPTGVCYRPEALGKCVAVPGKCILRKGVLYFPVCGCNGMTYKNDCERMMARVSKLHNGKC